MLVVFRTDASIEIGTGHVMRCLTLADALTQQGHSCVFICRAHVGHLGELIHSKGYTLHLLPLTDLSATATQELNWNAHAPWLGTTWQQDADQTLALLKQQKVDWLVVDHYALDHQWERRIQAGFHRLMVMDDLADREHQCNLLLDQTFGRSAADYSSLVPDYCEMLCGSQYALLRPEFAELRPYSLQRRSKPELRQLLIAMGGVDKDNVTGEVLDVLRNSDLPADCNIIVVMGVTAPWLESIKQQAQTLPWHTDVKVGVSNMAELMANSDLAIGAAGATSWERCCLGLPSILITIADNQQTIAKNMRDADAAKWLTDLSNVHNFSSILNCMDIIKLSHNASLVCDGLGTVYVFDKMMAV